MSTCSSSSCILLLVKALRFRTSRWCMFCVTFKYLYLYQKAINEKNIIYFYDWNIIFRATVCRCLPSAHWTSHSYATVLFTADLVYDSRSWSNVQRRPKVFKQKCIAPVTFLQFTFINGLGGLGFFFMFLQVNFHTKIALSLWMVSQQFNVVSFPLQRTGHHKVFY